MSVDILGTSCDQCQSTVQWQIFTSAETRRLIRTDSPGCPPRLSHSSWTMLFWLFWFFAFIVGCVCTPVWRNSTWKNFCNGLCTPNKNYGKTAPKRAHHYYVMADVVLAGKRWGRGWKTRLNSLTTHPSGTRSSPTSWRRSVEWTAEHTLCLFTYLTSCSPTNWRSSVEWVAEYTLTYLTRCSHVFNHVAGLERFLQLFTFFSWFCYSFFCEALCAAKE